VGVCGNISEKTQPAPTRPRPAASGWPAHPP
jgi:hypothetical protein